MDKSASITRPELSGPALPGGRLVLMPFSPVSDFLPRVNRNAWQKIRVQPGKLLYLNKTAVLLAGPGAPLSVMALEKVRNLGLKEILVLSYCGSLIENLRTGMALVATGALSQEGTSYHYACSRHGLYTPDKEMLYMIKNTLQRLHLPFASGFIVSTDAPYRETASWLKKLQRKKIVAVDMEMSAVLAFARFYRLKAAGLFIVTDELSAKKWEDGSRSQAVKSATEKYFYPLIFSE
ncbi:MAG: hypothetical protein QME28_03210 [Candidatus Saccharicenans sp.]|nr:hypothetical protein [Candidatus Saccharicenans sp.]